MDSSHVATGTIAALLATALIYFSKWPPRRSTRRRHLLLPVCSSPLAAPWSSTTNRGPRFPLRRSLP